MKGGDVDVDEAFTLWDLNYSVIISYQRGDYLMALDAAPGPQTKLDELYGRDCQEGFQGEIKLTIGAG